jgi:hypothetical protein
MHGLDSAGETVVARAGSVVHRHEVAMHGIDALGGAAAAELRFSGDEPGGLLGSLIRHLFRGGRGIHPLDQLVQDAFDFGDLGKLRLGSTKLLGYIGNLLLDMSERQALRGLVDRLGDLVGDLVEPCIQGLEGLRRHRHADRVLEPVRHLHETLVEIVLLAGERRGERRGGITRFREREAEGVAAPKWRLARWDRGGGKLTQQIGFMGRDARHSGGVVQVTRQGAPEAFEIVKRCGRFQFEPVGQAAHLIVQPVEGLGILRRAGRPRRAGRVRELVEPRMQIVKRLVIAALALLHPLHEAAKETFDRLLIHGAPGRGRVDIAAMPAGLPTCFRNHPVPLGESALSVRVRMVEGPVREDTRRSGRTTVASPSKFCVKDRLIVGRSPPETLRGGGSCGNARRRPCQPEAGRRPWPGGAGRGGYRQPWLRWCKRAIRLR